MRLIKVCFLCILILTGCRETKKLYMVPHSYNDKIYDNQKCISFILVADYEIDEVSDLKFAIEKSKDASYEEIKVDDIKLIDKYKGYNIYTLYIKILAPKGSLAFNKVTFTVNNSTKYTFDTNVYLTDEFEKEEHIYPGIEDEVFNPMSTIIQGFKALLTPTENMVITDIYFEGTKKFNLTNYIEEIYVNELLFVDDFGVIKKEKFNVDIRFKSDTLKDYAIIDHLIAKYKKFDSNEEKEAYMVVPLVLYENYEVAKNYIDNNLIK